MIAWNVNLHLRMWLQESRDGASRLCPDQFIAADFFVFVSCVCVHKNGSLCVCLRPIMEMDKLQPSGLSM